MKILKKETIRMNKKYFLFATTLILMVFLSSCSVYYNTNDLRNSMNSNINNLNDYYNKINRDYQDKNKLFTGIKKSTIDEKINPFLTISNHKLKLDKSFTSFQKNKDMIISQKNSFEKLVKGKDKITSNSVEWKSIKNIKSLMNFEFKKINENGENYSQNSNNFVNSINNSGLKQIEPNNFDEQISENLKNLNGSLFEVKRKLDKSKLELDNAFENNMINDSIYQSKKSIIKQMEIKAKEIKGISVEINYLHKFFKQNTLGKKKIWIGQNTKSNDLITRIQKSANSIGALTNEFNVLINKLNIQ